MHGRTRWYAHSYSDEELEEVTEKIVKAKPEKAYVFFNNDSAMLENSRKALNIFKMWSKQLIRITAVAFCGACKV
jgi:uncharacterized protein YecE (DUF72 family)